MCQKDAKDAMKKPWFKLQLIRLNNLVWILGLLIGATIWVGSKEQRKSSSKVGGLAKRVISTNNATNTFACKIKELGKREVIFDDLEWLVGKWAVVEKHLNTNIFSTPFAEIEEARVEQFIVYLPFWDDELCPFLTTNPDDRPIVADLLVRFPRAWRENSSDSHKSKKQSGSEREEADKLYPIGMWLAPARIGIRRMWFCGWPELIEFRYKRITENRGSSAPLLLMTNRWVSILLRKIDENPGPVKNARCGTLFKECPEWVVEYLHARFRAFAAALKKAGSITEFRKWISVKDAIEFRKIPPRMNLFPLEPTETIMDSSNIHDSERKVNDPK